ncbi:MULTISPECIES: FISUMP domain-containing protein [unclassified Fibrobacter]|uniref:FISUMP domain-containing protein n=1 Tax=unclassified Fibrobacter TaxID=2634177 RepID=UPI000D6BB3FD|nr:MULTISPECIES: FISUMP domain-containing protein [unclassified Fibrobacter]PWJ54715.1 uncharacterized protein (TIGR02145 family) [Fibrobacter sp. UWR4]PZW61325.1 uncharacterized protein (TIGR02145 family) [Fibrobacter sp. UWR1]
MNIFKKITLTSAVAFALFTFNACGDDSGSTSALGENGSLSSAVEDDDSSSSINDDSSSSVTPGSDPESSSSSKTKGSSSSVKGSESTGASSSSRITNSSSSTLILPCEAAEEGEIMTILKTGIDYICTNGFWVEISSSSSATSSSSYYDMSEQFNPDIEYGSMTDPRDGKVYKTVRVEYGYDDIDSITIFAENLNYGKLILGGTVQSDSTKYCYNDDPWYCDNGFGGLYSWSNAMNFSAACDSNAVGTDACPEKFNDSNGSLQHQGICPDGWHVMSTFAWNELLHITHFPDGSLFRSTHGSKAVFGGSNDYGVSILPGGYWNEEFKSIGQTAIFWTPIQSRDYPERANYIAIHSSSFNRNQALPKVQGYSIRCVQNYDRE